MPFDTPTEVVTGATNLPLALICYLCARWLSPTRQDCPPRLVPWRYAFCLFSAAAIVAACAHIFVIPATWYDWLWAPIFLALTLGVAFFLIGVTQDVAPGAVARAWPLALTLAGLTFLASVFLEVGFLVFIAFQSIGTILALLAYSGLFFTGRLGGAGWIALGLVITILAAAIQATQAVSFHLLWPFDHNAVFHLVQMPGMVAVAYGLRLGQGASAAASEDSRTAG